MRKNRDKIAYQNKIEGQNKKREGKKEELTYNPSAIPQPP